MSAERHDTQRFGHVATDQSNRCWASDLTTVWTLQDGLVAIMPVLDCGDRFVLDCEVTKSQESRVVLAAVARAVEKEFADPSAVPADLELRTDRGPQFTGRDCEAHCEHWRLDHTFAPVGRRTGNAVAERSLKLELIWTRDWDSLAELRERSLAGSRSTTNADLTRRSTGTPAPSAVQATSATASRWPPEP